jgi:hypothetical protein
LTAILQRTQSLLERRTVRARRIELQSLVQRAPRLLDDAVFDGPLCLLQAPGKPSPAHPQLEAQPLVVDRARPIDSLVV